MHKNTNAGMLHGIFFCCYFCVKCKEKGNVVLLAAYYLYDLNQIFCKFSLKGELQGIEEMLTVHHYHIFKDPEL